MCKTVILPDGLTAVAGQVLESVPDSLAMAYMADGRAEIWQELPNRVPVPDVVETREPSVEHREPTVRREPKRSSKRHA